MLLKFRNCTHCQVNRDDDLLPALVACFIRSYHTISNKIGVVNNETTPLNTQVVVLLSQTLLVIVNSAAQRRNVFIEMIKACLL